MSSPNGTSSAAPSPVLRLDPRTFIGPIFIGNVINWFLLGTLIVQVWVYYVNAVGDKLIIRLLVYSVFLLDIAQTVLGTHFAWYYGIANWDNFNVLSSPTVWSEATIPIMCGLVAAIVQIFYAWRIWTLKSTLLMRGMAVVIIAIAFGQGLSAIVAASIFEGDRTQQKLLQLHPAFSFWLAGSFVADILISACMIWILYNAKTHHGFSHSGTIINRLITNVIQTGTATVVCAGIDLALFVTLTDRNYHLTPAFILGKLYTNSLMVTLNARKSTRSAAAAGPATSAHAENYGMRVHVTRQTHRMHDPAVEDWPGAKLSQMDVNERSIAQNDTDTSTDGSGKHVRVVDFANPPPANAKSHLSLV